MIRILVDSSADYRLEELTERGMSLAPLTVTTGEGVDYQDEIQLPRKRVYEMLLDGQVLKTSQPSPEAFAELFRGAQEAGDELICILLSSALSGTCQSAVLAKDLVGYDHIHIVDSLSATAANQILSEKALAMVEEGYTAREIVDTLEALKGRVHIIAVVDTLKYLYLGGRISKTTAVVADTVNIKPGITLTRDGRIEVLKKYLGVARGIKDLAKQMETLVAADRIDPAYPVKLLYSYEDANCRKLEKALAGLGIRVQAICELGAALGVHIGPGAFGVTYVEK